MVKSLGGVDKVQDLLNSYNYNKKPTGNQVDFANPAPVADVHSHNRHIDSSLQDNGPITLLQPLGNSEYASPQRLNSRVINRQTTSSPFLNPSYVTPPRRQNEPVTGSPISDYSNQPILDNVNSNNDLLDIPRNTQPRQRRPQRIESTTESLPIEPVTSRTRSPFSFVYNEPMVRSNLNPSIFDNVDESLLAITEPPRRNNRQRGRTASTNVVIEPISQPIVDSVREQSQPSRPRIRGGNRGTNNNVAREPANNAREPTNVDGFFLYSQPTRSSRQPTISEPVREIEIKPRRNNQPNSRSRVTEGIGNSYSVPARVTSITNERSQNLPETAPSSSSTRKQRKPAKVRIQTGFSVINETPASPGVTYDEESDIIIPFNEPRSNNVRTNNLNSNNSRRKQQQNENRNAFTHHHSHNIGLEHHSLTGPNSIEIPSLSDSPPEPTIISRKPSQVRRRPPQRPHILNNPNVLVETDYNNNNLNTNNYPHHNQPSIDLEEPIVHSNHLSTTSNKGTTINPFSTYTGLSSIADIESTRINHGSSSVEPSHHSNVPSIHSLADDIESNYDSRNVELSNYNSNNLNTSPVINNPSSLGRETNSNDPINTTPYLTTLTTEKSISSISESVTTTPASTSYASSSVTTPAPSSSLSPVRGSSFANNNSIRGGASRGRHRSNSNTRAFETTPQPPKRATSSLPAVTRSPVVHHQPAVTSAPTASVSKSSATSSSDSSGSEPIVWDQATNKITCNKRGVHVHPQTCGQFVVCAPSKSQLKALVNHCPAAQVFVKEIGRCKPGKLH